jgi:hypothetical protein
MIKLMKHIFILSVIPFLFLPLLFGEISAKALKLALEAKYGPNSTTTAASDKKESGFHPSLAAKVVFSTHFRN